MAKKSKVAIVDDHPIVRRGIVATFAEQSDFEVIGEGATAADAASIVGDKHPDLIILDISMPGGGGVEAAAAIRKLDPSVKVMVLSIREDLATVRAALKAGARGYISKGVDGAELVASARKILAGERYVSPALAARLIEHEFEAVVPAAQKAGAPTGASLTQREQQIFDLLREGLTNQEIASRLGLSDNTVKHYITPLLHKLGVRNRTEAALLARTNRSTKSG